MNTNDGSRNREWAIALELIAASGARPGDAVAIAGTELPEVLIELIRRGFSPVLCRPTEHGPQVAPAADIAIAAEVGNEPGLEATLARLACGLRPRGVLVLSCDGSWPAGSDRNLRRLLIECGFSAIERITSRGAAETLWRVHKGNASLRPAA